MATAERVYIVQKKGADKSKPRMVRAAHPANALRHVAQSDYDISEEEAGWLYGKMSRPLSITLTAPPKTEGEPIDGTTGHPGAGDGALFDGPDDEDEGDTPEEALAATQE